MARPSEIRRHAGQQSARAGAGSTPRCGCCRRRDPPPFQHPCPPVSGLSSPPQSPVRAVRGHGD